MAEKNGGGSGKTEASASTEIGSVRVSTDVIFTYVSSAVLKTPGVVGFSGSISDALSKNILGRENKYKGVKIDSGDGGYTIDIFVVVRFGARIPDTAWNIQKNVKSMLESVMDIDIAGVNITVQGVSRSEGVAVQGQMVTHDFPDLPGGDGAGQDDDDAPMMDDADFAASGKGAGR
jgi:uncharacterized alkaline shock family protein YloU